MRRSILLFFVLAAMSCHANTTELESLAGLWRGTIDGRLNMALEFGLDPNDEWQVNFFDLDRQYMQIRASNIAVTNDSLSLSFNMIGSMVKGEITKDDTLRMDWVQAGRRATMKLWRSEPIEEIERRKALTATGMSSYAPLELGQFAFLLGTFHGYEKRSFDGVNETLTMTEWRTNWILDGNVIQNESRAFVMLDSLTRGRMIQLGQDTRKYLNQTREWTHVYVDGFSDMVLNFKWTYKDGVLSSAPTEWGGALNVIHFRDIRKDSFTWSTDSSTDGGKTWKKDTRVMKNIRVSDQGL